MYQAYQLLDGETLEDVALRLDLEVESLRSLNSISDFRDNSYIVIPSQLTQPNFNSYVVKKGDNIYQIAQQNSIDYKDLLKLNGLDEDDYIYPNQEILVPKKDIGIYITNDNDTISLVSKHFNTTSSEILRQNPNLYLESDQLIIYKKG